MYYIQLTDAERETSAPADCVLHEHAGCLRRPNQPVSRIATESDGVAHSESISSPETVPRNAWIPAPVVEGTSEVGCRGRRRAR